MKSAKNLLNQLYLIPNDLNVIILSIGETQKEMKVISLFSCITNFKELNIKETLNATENQSKFVNKIILFRVFSQMV